jgi:hypothetical protein
VYDDVLAALPASTGGLRPGTGITFAELTELRRAVVQCLQHGQAETDIGPPLAPFDVRPADTAELEYIGSLPSTATSSGRLRISRRSSPLRTDLSAVPAWAARMQPAQSFGPFLDATGPAHWFDTFLIPQQATHRVADRPDRFEPRMTKRRPKNYDRLTRPRREIKREMIERFSEI